MNSALQPQVHHLTCAHAGGLHQIAYREWFDSSSGPKEAARVVVCVHGLTRRATDFDTLARTMAGRGWRVVCPDMIGRGDSDWVAQPMLYSVPQYVSDCVTLVARLGVESVDWVGTSMGGLIGMTYAALSGHPIRRMVLNDIGPKLEWAGLSTIAAYVGQVPVFTEYAEAASWLRGRMGGFGPHDEAGWEQLIRPYFKVLPDGGFTPHYDPAIAVPFKALAQGGVSGGEPNGKPAGESEEHSMWPLWDTVTASTLVLRGSLSELLSTETCEGMKVRGPKAQVIEIAGVGHAPSLIAPDQINPILEFFSESSSS